jgi:hypothetical protein
MSIRPEKSKVVSLSSLLLKRQKRYLSDPGLKEMIVSLVKGRYCEEEVLEI